ncbi:MULTISPECIES: VOC family protein [Actinoalloteichus]|uniref:Glyoxalase-like domain n=1 Tax=Actinoalloteichus fjordicus TaxID=1612552 RepID=A0AAC9LDE1_9PSEU|nr:MULTISPECIES: VOC family protein [Actinoalloteichus]APU15793.1 Glyoxalase-like domain [Actinoalloteichus fjordicus]APU21853.1 Glyoxalase-like domain [Actinoalloteichus sp. GBA129-24]
MIGRWHALVIDCPEPAELAGFYQEVLGMVRVQDEADWVVIGDAPDRPGIAFQRAPEQQAPRWPDPHSSQQMHVDVRVDDLDEGERAVLALGARRLPSDSSSFRVFADPSGHPFCLVRW